MIKILAIGNSFSQDATRYLHQAARSAGVDTKIVNLYIGGCPLERHWKNIETNEKAYGYELNGMITERRASIDEVLEEDTWDYIITQQVSGDSGWLNTYEPFLGLVLNHIREKAPAARILLHETWAYEINSTHGNFMRYNRNQQEMYERLHSCYTQMAGKYALDLIPSGSVIQAVRKLPEFCVPDGGLTLCRDGFHMSFDYGRYLLALVWCKTILGISPREISYIPESVAVFKTPEEKLLAILRNTAEEYTI